MSWFTRKKDWAEEEVLTAADLNTELDAIAAALNSTSPVQIVTGAANITYGGGIEATQTITHTLSDVPTFAWIAAEDAGYVAACRLYTKTTFLASVQKRDGTSPGAGTIAPIKWIAIR